MSIIPTAEQIADQDAIWSNAKGAYASRNKEAQSLAAVITKIPPRTLLSKEEAIQKIATNIEKRIEDGRREVYRKQSISYEDARIHAFDIAKKLAIKRREVLKIEPSQRKIWENTIKYFIVDPEGVYHPEKSLFFWGDTGCGKTFLMEVMEILCKELQLKNHLFRSKTCEKIGDEVRETKMLDSLAQYTKGNWLLDDIGREDYLVKILHGEVVDPLAKLLERREIAWRNEGTLTHITANMILLPMSQEEEPFLDLHNRFDAPLVWRIIKMSNIIHFPGENRRNPFSRINAGTKPAIF